jgi:hypothetical protein
VRETIARWRNGLDVNGECAVSHEAHS